ncbi:ABC transporter substrate-binding protein, partial [bacterium]|nr:ABC transporter substrate-binding protein [bacterium]
MKYFIQSIFLLSALLAVNGCNFNNRPYDTLMLRLKEDISTTDPAYIVDVDGSNIAAYLYNGLVKLDKSMQIVPDIAERWEISNDGLSYRFFIRTDVKFTTGEYCTAEHIKRSFMRILDPLICSPRSWIFEQVDGASDYIRGLTGEVTGFMVISPHIFQIQLKEPFAPFLSLLTMPNAFVGIPANTAPAYIIGTGPFYIEKWIRGDKLLLRQNPSYFEGAPHIEHILIRVIPEDFTAITEFETGMLDIMDIPSAEFEYFTRNTLWKDSVHSVELLNTYYLGFNCQKEPCSDVQFRRTVASGISTDKIIQYYFQNRVEKAVSPVPSALLKPYGIEVNNFNVDTSGTDTNMP